jgi:transcriptional regulator with XRE-family HTH domain
LFDRAQAGNPKRVRSENVLRYLRFIAANTRKHRQRLGYTQEELAEIADLDLRFIQRIERASTNLSISVLVALADALRVVPTALMRAAKLAPARPGRPRKHALAAASSREGTHDSSTGPASTTRPRGR